MGSKTSTTATALSNEEKEKLAREKFKKAHKATFDGDSISAEGIRELRAKGPEPIIVDVRTEDERKVSQLQGSIDEEQFWGLDEKSIGDRPIVAYCTIGFRSGLFAQKLKKQGFPHVYNSEGVVLWTHDPKAEPLIRIVTLHDEGKSKHIPVKEVHVYGNEWDLADDSYKSEMFTSMSSVTVGVLGTLRSVISRSIFKSKKPPPSAEDGTRQSLRTTPGRDAVEKKGPT